MSMMFHIQNFRRKAQKIPNVPKGDVSETGAETGKCSKQRSIGIAEKESKYNVHSLGFY